MVVTFQSRRLTGSGQCPKFPTAFEYTGRLKLVLGDGEIDLGSIYLPLTVTRVSPAKAPYMHLGICVDLDQVRTAIADLFALAETDDKEEP